MFEKEKKIKAINKFNSLKRKSLITRGLNITEVISFQGAVAFISFKNVYALKRVWSQLWEEIDGATAAGTSFSKRIE